MSKLMRRHGAPFQRRATPGGCANVFVKDVLKARPGHCRSLCINEQLRYWELSAHCEPGSKVGGSFLPKWKTAFLSSLAKNANTWHSLQGKILQQKPH
jgi:hypothetical protein